MGLVISLKIINQVEYCEFIKKKLNMVSTIFTNMLNHISIGIWYKTNLEILQFTKLKKIVSS